MSFSLSKQPGSVSYGPFLPGYPAGGGLPPVAAPPARNYSRSVTKKPGRHCQAWAAAFPNPPKSVSVKDLPSRFASTRYGMVLVPRGVPSVADSVVPSEMLPSYVRTRTNLRKLHPKGANAFR
eukprot:1544289-Rhodomonas_salina.2